MSKHTPGPWKAVPANCRLKTWFIGSANKAMMPVHVEKVRRQADAERIVACVNAMEGIDDPHRMRKVWDDVKELKLDAYYEMKAERDKLLADLAETRKALIKLEYDVRNGNPCDEALELAHQITRRLS